jgi:hypothetical protein
MGVMSTSSSSFGVGVFVFAAAASFFADIFQYMEVAVYR